MSHDDMLPYEARPIDTPAIELPEEAERVIPVLAENAHDVWAFARSSEGWRFGKERELSNSTRTVPPPIKWIALVTEWTSDYTTPARRIRSRGKS